MSHHLNNINNIINDKKNVHQRKVNILFCYHNYCVIRVLVLVLKYNANKITIILFI